MEILHYLASSCFGSGEGYTNNKYRSVTASGLGTEKSKPLIATSPAGHAEHLIQSRAPQIGCPSPLPSSSQVEGERRERWWCLDNIVAGNLSLPLREAGAPVADVRPMQITRGGGTDGEALLRTQWKDFDNLAEVCQSAAPKLGDQMGLSDDAPDRHLAVSREVPRSTPRWHCLRAGILSAAEPTAQPIWISAARPGVSTLGIVLTCISNTVRTALLYSYLFGVHVMYIFH